MGDDKYSMEASKSRRFRHFFTEFTFSKAFLYVIALLYVSIVSVLSILQPFFLDICKDQTESLNLDFENPVYDQRICRRTRARALLYLTPEECGFGRRIVISALLGGLIGWERRNADRPAGIRTMSLVSLGACLFSICSSFAFIEGPVNWDGSRKYLNIYVFLDYYSTTITTATTIDLFHAPLSFSLCLNGKRLVIGVAAAIPSGVGFLGAAVIWKQVNKEEDGHTVHGLTTAASVWLSAAVGIACSGELYFAATFSVAIMLLMLRFGPRGLSEEFEEEEDELDDFDEELNGDIIGRQPSYAFRDVPATAPELQHLNPPGSPVSFLSPSVRSNRSTGNPTKRSVQKIPSLKI